jgi:hypothetical protein
MTLYYAYWRKLKFENDTVKLIDPIYWDKRKYMYEYLLNLTIEINDKGFVLFNKYLKNILDLFKINVPSDFDKNNSSYMLNFHKLISKQLSKLDPRIDKKKFLITLLETFINSNSTLFTNLFILPQDVYFLLRLFIKFDLDKMSRGPTNCHDSNNVIINNAIVYAGVYHSMIYQKFIENYFDIKPLIEINQPEDQKCIEFDQPFDFFM